MKTTCPAGTNTTQNTHFSLWKGLAFSVPQEGLRGVQIPNLPTLTQSEFSMTDNVFSPYLRLAPRLWPIYAANGASQDNQFVPRWNSSLDHGNSLLLAFLGLGAICKCYEPTGKQCFFFYIFPHSGGKSETFWFKKWCCNSIILVAFWLFWTKYFKGNSHLNEII